MEADLGRRWESEVESNEAFDRHHQKGSALV